MVSGVENAKQTLAALAELTCDVVTIVKNGAGFSSIKKAFEVMEDVRKLIEAAPGALPELLDLDTRESAELGAAAYSAIRKIVDTVRAV